MVAKNLLNDVLALPVGERLELYEHLRKNLLNDPELHPTNDEEKRLLDERIADYERNGEASSPWEEVEARLLGLLKDRA